MAEPLPTRSSIFELPGELVTEILSYLSPPEITNFGITCKQAQQYLDPGNKTLWRFIFINVFEDPRKAWQRLTPTARAANRDAEEAWNWHEELSQRLDSKRMILCADTPIGFKRKAFDSTMRVLLNILDTGAHDHKFFNHPCPHPEDRNISFLKSIFAHSAATHFIHDFSADINSPMPLALPNGPLTRSKAAKRSLCDDARLLHIYHGPTVREGGGAPLESIQAKGAARALVYDWSHFTQATDHGPFHADGRVNWAVLEAVASLMAEPIHTQTERYSVCPHAKASTPTHAAHVHQDPHEDANGNTNGDPAWDWAGIAHATHSWMGTYAFLDYADLAWYNFSRSRGAAASLAHLDEAAGLLSRLCLHRDDSLADDASLATKLPVCADLPVIYFRGSSQSQGLVHTHGLGIRGRVSLVPGGRAVRWRFVVRYAGLDQWQLEGVQPGGIRTGPIFGIWSGCDHEDNGPVGPFSYFTEEDEKEDEDAGEPY